MHLPKLHVLPFHFHHHHWNINIVEYYLYQALYMMAHMTINLFLPIYLISIGYSLFEVILWHFINQIWFSLIVPFSGTIIRFWGLRKTIILKLPAMAIFFYALNSLTGDFSKDMYFAIGILFIRVIFKAPADLAEDVFFTKYVLRKAEGKMLAWLKIIIILAGILAPLIGGIVAYFFGFKSMFLAGIVLLMLSAIPLFLTPEKHFQINYTSGNLFDFTLHKMDKSYLAAEAGRIFPDTVMWLLWPIFIYVIIENTADLGAIVSLSAFVSMMLAYYIGKKVDQVNPQKLLKKGVQTSSVLYCLRAFCLNPLLIGIIDIANKVINPIVEIPYNYYIYRFIKTHPNRIEMLNIKQLVMENMYTMSCAVLLVITYFFPEPNLVFFSLLFVVFSGLLLLMQRISNIDVVNREVLSSPSEEKLQSAEKI